MQTQFLFAGAMRGACMMALIIFQSSCSDAASLAGSSQSAKTPDTRASSSAEAFYATTFENHPSVAAMTALGRSLFMDPSLSASGKVSCASCHSPDHAYGPANDLPVQMGGAKMDLQGVRAVPSLRYMQNVPAFNEHFHDDDGDDSIDQGPAGGHTWDGRADSVHDQAKLPLLSPLEMANESPAAVVGKIRKSGYAAAFRETFGPKILDRDDQAFNAVLLALEVFQQSPADFYPYSSKYDAVLRKQSTLTAQEARGLALFNDPRKGNCAACHPSAIKEGAFPSFSDFGYIAAGVPRNLKIPTNTDAAYYDLGLCGPLRTDLKDHKEYCGRFRTPSLRNVATRKVFFHNGVFHSLEEVIRFYAQRDTSPQKWYPRDAGGRVQKFNDLPSEYQANVNMEPPFGGKVGDRPAFTETEIRDMIAFLKTLTDGDQSESRAAH